MAFGRSSTPLPFLGLLSYLLLHHATTTAGIRLSPEQKPPPNNLPAGFREAPAFVNAASCGSHDDDKIHISMTLDGNYLRGTMAAIFSTLQHSTCPENLVFHFLAAGLENEIQSTMSSTFPYLTFKIYRFDSNRVRGRYRNLSGKRWISR
ncbi:hypothetical protein Nepgr_030299 [Nepenthes gracilis]|uniref:Uncharacterized protein n=1 Tax=Nepenthes gracilis TaxID=150966 RepID=A0AAD3Y6F2_NEPGR|nr:hypothetical protein Nepgr_030299 [Nepenthes gracilis]